MLATRGLGHSTYRGTLVGAGMGRTFGQVILSTFQDIVDFVLHITRSVSISLER